MNRREFTRQISRLILEMRVDGHEPVYDHCMRSEQEQNRLYKAGLSKCDGKTKISAHQRGRAMDIYFVIDNKEDFGYEKTADLALKYHDLWASLGGKPIFRDKDGKPWDHGHYEG